MLEIVLVFAVFCSAVTIGVVGLGFFDKKGIYERIRKKTEDEVAGNMTVVESQGVDTAAISPLKKEMYVNIKDISDEITDTAQTMYSAIRNDYKLLKDIGLGQVETYKEFARKVGGKVIDSAASHEIGHLVSGASEVGAELYRSAKEDLLSAEDKLEYATSFYNLIKKGGEEGYKTAQETYKVLNEKYGEAVAPVKYVVNKMTGADSSNNLYKSKAKISGS